MDKYDRKIISILTQNSKETYRNIAKSVKLSKDTVKYRVEKLIKTGVIVRFNTNVDLSQFKLEKYDIYFRFVNDKDMQRAISLLSKSKKVTWLGKCFGTYDLRTTYVAQNHDELYQDFLDFKIEAETTICKVEKQTKKPMTQLNKLLLGVEIKENKIRRKQTIMSTIGKEDRLILNMLSKNARIKNIDIAKKLNTSPENIHYKIKKLEKSGVILQYSTELDTTKLGKVWCIALFKMIRVDKDTIKKLNSFVSKKNVSIYTLMTGEWNMSLAFFEDSIDKIQKTLADIKKELSGDINRIEPLLVLERVFKDINIS